MNKKVFSSPPQALLKLRFKNENDLELQLLQACLKQGDGGFN